MKKSNTWVWVTVIAVLVAALTAAVIFLVRLQMKLKKKKLLAQNEAVDYMMGDFEEGCEACDECCDSGEDTLQVTVSTVEE